MGIPLTRQLNAILYACLCGVLLGSIYDVFRLLRALLGVTKYTRAANSLYNVRFPLIGSVRQSDLEKVHPAMRTIIYLICDTAFALLAGCVFSVFLYTAASGCFRWFYLIFAGVGFTVYQSTIGRLVSAFSDVLIVLIRIVIRYAFYISCVPYRLIINAFRNLSQFFASFMVAPVIQLVYNKRSRRYTQVVKKALSRQIRI